MSFQRMVTARCDNALQLVVPRPEQVPPPADCEPVAEGSGWTIDEAWRVAKEYGWHRNGNRTICPACWNAGAR